MILIAACNVQDTKSERTPTHRPREQKQKHPATAASGCRMLHACACSSWTCVPSSRKVKSCTYVANSANNDFKLTCGDVACGNLSAKISEKKKRGSDNLRLFGRSLGERRAWMNWPMTLSIMVSTSSREHAVARKTCHRRAAAWMRAAAWSAAV